MERPGLSPEDAKRPKQMMGTGEDTSQGHELPDKTEQKEIAVH